MRWFIPVDQKSDAFRVILSHRLRDPLFKATALYVQVYREPCLECVLWRGPHRVDTHHLSLFDVLRVAEASTTRWVLGREQRARRSGSSRQERQQPTAQRNGRKCPKYTTAATRD